jgi:hypothetical protein
MFEHLNDKRNILVTGCQRSGTRLVAKAIAQDTGFTYIDETVLQPLNLNGKANEFKFRFMNRFFSKQVFHAPQLSHLCDQFHGMCVVWVKRDPKEVRESMERIGWKCEAIERENYEQTEGDIITIKNTEWERQKRNIADFVEVNYTDMANHPLYLADRDDFKWWQTQ